MSYPERYELVFEAPTGAQGDVVVVRRTEFKGAGGHPIYMDETGIVRAEISDRGEIRMLATGGHQAPKVVARQAASRAPTRARLTPQAVEQGGSHGQDSTDADYACLCLFRKISCQMESIWLESRRPVPEVPG